MYLLIERYEYQRKNKNQKKKKKEKEKEKVSTKNESRLLQWSALFSSKMFMHNDYAIMMRFAASYNVSYYAAACFFIISFRSAMKSQTALVLKRSLLECLKMFLI